MAEKVADKKLKSSSLSDFVINASPSQKKRFYTEVMKMATRAQLDVIERAKAM